jgi:hypothetical protein
MEVPLIPRIILYSEKRKIELMKLYFRLLLFILFLACNPAKKDSAKEEMERAFIEADTLHRYDILDLSGKTIRFIPGTQPEFEGCVDKGSVPENPNDDSLLLLRDKQFIQKKDSIISIRCRSGLVTLTEHTTTDGEGYQDYKYAGTLKDNPTAVFSEGFNLGLDYVLVNAHSGKKNMLWALPQLSEDGKKIVSASYDLDAGFMHNGIQVYAVEVDSLRLLWQQEFEDWGPAQVKWVDNHTIIIKQMGPAGENGKEVTTFAKVKLD